MGEWPHTGAHRTSVHRRGEEGEVEGGRRREREREREGEGGRGREREREKLTIDGLLMAPVR